MAKDNKSLVTINKNEGMSGFVLLLAWIGALVYFVGQVDGFWNIVLAFLKSCVWPALVLHRTLEILQL